VSAALLADRAGVLAWTGPPKRRTPRRPARAVAGFAPRLVGPACIVTSCASLQTASALATTLFAAYGPVGTGALRFLPGALVLLALVRPRFRGRSTGSWVTIAAAGAAMAATNFLVYEAIARIPLGAAMTIVFLGPLALALFAARRRLDVAWAFAALAGVVMLTGGPSGASATGVAFALAAAGGVAVATLITRRVADQTDGHDGLALSITVAALLTLPVGLPVALSSPELGDLGVVSAVGMLGIALPYALEFDALRRVGVKTYSILLSLDPAVAGLAGLVLLGQHLSPPELFGIALVMGASVGAVASRPVS
jgi:inner membrane transporter RhtA